MFTRNKLLKDILTAIQSTTGLVNRVNVSSPEDLSGALDPTKQYFVDGVIDFTGTGLNITVPAGGLRIKGLGNDISGLICSDDNYELFASPVGGSGTLNINDLYITTSGTSSKVNALTDVDGTNAYEITGVNFIDCTSLGYLDGYRQGLEFNTARFGGSPEFEFRNAMNGYRVSTSIVRGVTVPTSLFKTGAGLVFGGRFIMGINADLPATGALIDFSESNITNDEALIIEGAFVTRNGTPDASDTTLYPNINHQSVKSNWGDNTGLPNTRKYLKSTLTVAAETVISAVDTYYPIAGTKTVDVAVQFDSPVNGQYRLLTGNGVYQFSGTLLIDGTNGDLIDVRVVVSDDDGVTFPTEINHIQQEIPNYAGASDFATYTLNFVSELKKNQRVRIEVENKTSTNNVTLKTESFFVITEV